MFIGVPSCKLVASTGEEPAGRYQSPLVFLMEHGGHFLSDILSVLTLFLICIRKYKLA